MERFVIGTTKISEEKLNKLKEKTGEPTTKEALARAIEHYLTCHDSEVGQKELSGDEMGRLDRLISLKRKNSGKVANFERF